MNIREVQAALLSLGFDPKGIDGKLGRNTKAAIEAFQKAYGLYVDGIAGTQTKTALTQAIAAPKPGRPEPDKSAMAAPVPATISRSETVAANAPPNVSSLALLDTVRPITEIINHCTATAEGKDYTVADIRAWHKQRGFSDIGYHYLVYRDGRIMVGRPIGQIGAHVEGHNTGTIGVSYVGGVAADGKTAKDTRTSAQRASLLWLNKALLEKHRGVRKITGHNQYAAKACPSFDVRKDDLGRLV